jgi:SusD family.
MKTKYIILLCLAGSSIFTGCKKDFLETSPSQFVSREDFARASEQDPSLLNGTVAGLYVTMYTTGTGGTTDHDDFGQKGYDIYMDMISSDMVLGATIYGWYSTVARYQATTDYTRNEAYRPWRYYYRIILGANIVLDAMGGDSTEQTEEVQRHAAGQALAMRAYAYFYLSQLYAKGYNASEKILPIYRNTVVPNQPKSTAQEVYALMESDLRKAIDYLADFERSSKDQIDQSVAKGLLAYVLAARGSNADLTEAIALSNDILGDFPLTSPAQATGGFNNVATPSWMWGVDLTLASNLDLVSWWGQVDLFTYSYAWAGDPKLIDDGLYASIKDDDIRKTQFDDGWPINKFYAPARTVGGQRNITSDYIYMRADEFLLLKAESQARLGLDDEARTTLKQLLDLRMDDYSYVDGLSGTALQDEIHLQTRIELWGEGKTYLAMKRTHRGCTRGDNHLFEAGETFTWDAPELTFLIPQSEVLNNPNLNK